ncbi:MAG: ABC transporter permease [Gemmatimonadetes bacterium]|nr:ABC transporter permease [Gemmatimonadota bacterium]
MREWLTRVLDWMRRGHLDSELQDELRFHAEQIEAEARAAGASPDEAQAIARRRLGPEVRVRQATRDRWSLFWLDDLLQDLRHAVRGFVRAPAFAGTVILTLGLGIGVGSLMFGLVDATLFRPHPFLREPDQVHRVYLQWDRRGERVTNGTSVPFTRFLDLERWGTRGAELAAVTERRLAVGAGLETRERNVAIVSAGLFDLFDAPPALGRYFLPSEDIPPGGAPVAVLGYSYWKNELGGRDVIGSTIRVRDLLCEIIGVAPEGFVGVAEGEAPSVFLPITAYASAALSGADPSAWYTTYSWGWMGIVARTPAGVDAEEITADLSTAFQRSWRAEVDLDGGPSVEESAPRVVLGALRTAAGPAAPLQSRLLLWVFGVAGVVLLITCANVANLIVARSIRRSRETAVRLALGVRRGRLVRQALTESLVLAAAGCLTGLALAYGGERLFRRLVDVGMPEGILTDPRTLLFAILAAVATSVLSSLGPLLVGERGDVVERLKAGPREGGGRRDRVRGALLVAQVALSTVLLIGAGLFVGSFENVRALRLGYDADALVLVFPQLRGARLETDETVALGERLLAAGTRLPGVEAGSVVSTLPFLSEERTALFVEGLDSVSNLGAFSLQTASADYFPTFGTQILRGRGFGSEDRAGAPPVVVVSEAMAEVLWPGQEALGRCLRLESPGGPCRTVIGVSENAFHSSLQEDARLRYYLPMAQYPGLVPEALVLRVQGDPARFVDAVRTALQPEMPGEGYVTVRPFTDLVDGQQRPWRLGALLFAAFGALALIVASVGLYGAVAYGVAQRLHELGVRAVLGARRHDLMTLVVGRAVRWVGTGAVVGIALALLLSRWVQPLLFDQRAVDPLVYLAVVAGLLVVSVVAAAAPARTAGRADPVNALRAE